MPDVGYIFIRVYLAWGISAIDYTCSLPGVRVYTSLCKVHLMGLQGISSVPTRGLDK